MLGLAALTRWAPPLVLLALGLGQILQLRPMWYDEEYSQLAASVPLTTLLGGIWQRQGLVSYLMDVPPSFNGPYYLLLHGWTLVAGDSATSLRVASLLGAAAAAGVLAELVRRLGGAAVAPWTGLLAGLLVATNPLVIAETTQARSYGWALLALALTALWLHTWLTTGRRGAATVVAAGLAALLHWFTLPVLAGFAVYAVVSRGRSGWRIAGPLALSAAPAVALIGWSLAGGAQAAPHPVAVGGALPAIALYDWSGQQLWLAIALGAAALLGITVRRTRSLVVCWVVLPLALVTAVELVRPSYFPRYLLFTLVGVAVAGAIGVGSLPGWWSLQPTGGRSPLLSRRSAASGIPRTGRPATSLVRVASLLVGAALVAGCLVAAGPIYAQGPREPSPDVVTYLAEHQTAGEPVVPADGRTSLDLMTSIDLAPRLQADLVLPPTLFTDQTTSDTVWLVRVVLKVGSLPIVEAEQRLIDAGWTLQESTLFTGATTDLKVERWTR